MNKKLSNLIIPLLTLMFAVYLTGTVSAQFYSGQSPLQSVLKQGGIEEIFGNSIAMEFPASDPLVGQKVYVSARARNFDPDEAVFSWFWTEKR